VQFKQIVTMCCDLNTAISTPKHISH